MNRQMPVRITEDLQLMRLLHSSEALDSSEQRIAAGAADLEHNMRRLSRITPLLEPVGDLMPVLAAAMMGAQSGHLCADHPAAQHPPRPHWLFPQSPGRKQRFSARKG